MKSDAGIFDFEFVLDFLGIIWTPGAEALKLQQDLNVRSLEDIPAAVERAGYEVCYADLPMNVSGVALVIAGRPCIVVNRAKSPQHQHYTIAHELGHHVLHVNPPQDRHQLGLPSKDMMEFQAHLFAAMWVMRVTNDKEREVLLRQNPESLFIPPLSILLTIAMILGALFAHLCSRLFPAQLSGSGERK
jgi:hypothetical protein